MLRCIDCEKSVELPQSHEIVTEGKLFVHEIVVEGKRVQTYGAEFYCPGQVVRIPDISLEEAQVRRFIRLVVEEGDVPIYQVYELVEDFLAQP